MLIYSEADAELLKNSFALSISFSMKIEWTANTILVPSKAGTKNNHLQDLLQSYFLQNFHHFGSYYKSLSDAQFCPCI